MGSTLLHKALATLEEIRQICNQHDLADDAGSKFKQVMAVQVNTLPTNTPTSFLMYFTTAKGLGNGFPIGAVMTQGRGVGVLTAGNHGSTYSGLALGSRVVYTIIDIMQKENIVQNAAEQGCLHGRTTA